MKADFDGVGSGEDAFGGHERAQREGGDDVLVAATALADEGGVVRRAIDDKVGDVGVVVRGTVEDISLCAGAAGLPQERAWRSRLR